LLPRSVKRYTRRALRSIVTLHGSPEAIALGTAIGVFVAFTPTVGFQMMLGALLATLVGANRPAAMVPAWITNPVTIPPIYTLTYFIGRLFVGGPSVKEVYGRLLELVKSLGELSWLAFYEQLRLMLATGVKVFVPMLIGGCILGAICAAVAYALMLRALRTYRARRERRRRHRAARRAQRERRRQAEAADPREPPQAPV
jgi:uncharacterized protein (DUF2062 family)